MIPQGAGPRYRSESVYTAAQLTFLVWMFGVLLRVGPAVHLLLFVVTVLVSLALRTGDRRSRSRWRSPGRRAGDAHVCPSPRAEWTP